MKAGVEKLVINKWVNVSASLNNLKTKVDYLDVDKLKTVPIDLKNVIHIVNKEVAKNAKPNTLKTKVNKLYKKILHATTLIHINQHSTDKQILNNKVGAVEKKLLDLIGLMTTTVLDGKIKAVSYKIPDLGGFVKKTVYDAKILEIDGKIF